jgi:hypothetical protein
MNLIKAIRNVYSNTHISIQGQGQQRSENIKTNKGVRQGCGLSPILFNFYINRLVKEWKAKTKSEIQVTKNNKISTILYSDDQILLATSEDELQLASLQLNKIDKEYIMSISTEKTKAIAMCGNTIKRVKIEIQNRIIEPVSDFKYLGNMFSDHLKDKVKKKVKLSRYTPWRQMGGEEV